MKNRGIAVDSQVVIVGAGPTGLVLACELLALGIDVRIIDKNDGAVLETRAIGMQARMLEVLDSMGIVERFLDHGQRVRWLRWHSDGRLIASFDLSYCGSPFGFLLDIPQNITERLLRDRVAELGGVIEELTELTGFTQDADCVAARVRDPWGVTRTVTASYLVGCDGAHSRVRHDLGLAFEGHPYSQDWLLADVLVDWDRAEDSVQAMFRTDMPPLIGFPMLNHRWRLTVPYAGARQPGPPTLEEFQEFVSRRVPERPRISDPTWLASFHVHRRSSPTYRQGRVLLAGDAVHVHSPAGGQGMNTGMMDAHNLGWKLALVASGHASEELLDTYREERGPVAERVLSLTHALVRVGTLERGFTCTLRDRLLPVATRSRTLQRRAACRISQIGVDYRASSLARGGGGARMADQAVSVDGRRTRLYELLRQRQHVLLVPLGAPAEGLERFRSLLTIAEANVERATLVRPDGYVAARARGVALESLIPYLQIVLAGSSGEGAEKPHGSGALSPARVK